MQFEVKVHNTILQNILILLFKNYFSDSEGNIYDIIRHHQNLNKNYNKHLKHLLIVNISNPVE